MVDAGGREVVLAGGSISGGLTLSGGAAVISGAMAAGQTVRFVGAGGVLELANLPAFGAAISGLTLPSQKLDLDGFVYHSATETAVWTQSGTSGTLTVSDGAKIATLDLIGSYATSDFQLSSDGHGGTFVVDPPLTISSGVTSSGLTVSSGETVDVLSGGLVSSSTIASGGTIDLSSGGVGESLTISSGGRMIGPGELGGPDRFFSAASYDYGVVSAVSIGGLNGLFAVLFVEAGGSTSGVTLRSGDLEIESGATTIGTLTSGVSAGAAHADIYGVASGTVDETGGVEFVYSGGVAYDPIARSGGVEGVGSGGVIHDVIVSSGGALGYAGGVLSGATVESEGTFRPCGGASSSQPEP